ncbi:peptidase M15A [Leptolyngbya sp. NK1-12]|uniref:Peptidase M15A n=1 Tax=Leptolyngbya sp. NK1-12 TaxID=2547451 RepID=A0AA97AH97_9CYAN|nr:peptidase M15A [Leptolyngbya sp. NK1-12]WNZ24329.1 peptidase M15A [Leptolyngbya sp. NK1-12]
MAGLSAEQRNDYYLREATRTGIHKPILAALFVAQARPSLRDGEVGLGISPANRIPLEQVNTFAEQVQYAANTIRSITERLATQGWKGDELWDADQGRYADRFIEMLANGYVPPASDPAAARLEPTSDSKLLQAYLEDWTLDCKTAGLPPSFAFLDPALLRFTSEIPRYYLGISYQRQALLEAIRIWRQFNTRQSTLAALLERDESDPTLASLDATRLDQPLLQFLQQIPANYGGYPHQRESLLRLVQLWYQCSSREAAIARLESAPTAETSISMIDPGLMAWIQRIGQSYQGKGDQRNALTETYRLWYGLESRSAALQELGLDSQVLAASNPNRNALITVATQLDRALVDFIKRIPMLYQETDAQREALIRLVQMWQGLEGREQTLQVLLDEVQRLEGARRDSIDAMPKPDPLPLPPRPTYWTPNNLQMHAAIVENGCLTWAEATQAGIHLPTTQATVDAIVRIADLAQQAYDRLGRPFHIITWYRPMEAMTGRATSPHRHAIGDAIAFYCDGLTGDQIYRTLDPWWTGGLGRYRNYPYLCYLDARGDRVRWTQA